VEDAKDDNIVAFCNLMHDDAREARDRPFIGAREGADVPQLRKLF
jgi:hypothetical protein